LGQKRTSTRVRTTSALPPKADIRQRIEHLLCATSRRHPIGPEPLTNILKRRIDRARDLLRLNEKTISEIAYAVGFSSQSHLTCELPPDDGGDAEEVSPVPGLRQRVCPLRVISGHTDKSTPCPLYPQQRTLGGASKSAFGCRFMSTRPSVQNRLTKLCPQTSVEPIRQMGRPHDPIVRDHRSRACSRAWRLATSSLARTGK
jgi:hypothetical protein